MKVVMACVDFSPVTDEVLKRSFDLGKALGARVCLVHVVAPLPIVGPEEALSPPLEVFPDERLKSARQQIDALRERKNGEGIEIKTLIYEGIPATCLLAAAEQEKAELIVIGSHGLGFLRRVLMGSTAMGVLKGARCPVLVVPSKRTSD